MGTRRGSVRCRPRLDGGPLIPLLLTLAACSTAAPRQTGFQQSLGAQVSSQEIRLRVTEYAAVFSEVVEVAADSILVLTSDRDVARNALVWKSYAIPAIYRSATLPDPLAAWIDAQILTVQMLDYFETGGGTELFGDLQPIAVESARALTEEAPRVVRLAGREVNEEQVDSIRSYARRNRLENPYFFRRSTIDMFASELAQERVSGLQAVGSMTELLSDMNQRLNVYLETLPRAGRWQMELMLTELADPERSAIYLEVLNQLEAMETLNRFLLDMPDLLDVQREYLFDAVEVQRSAFEESLGEYLRMAVDTVFTRVQPERAAVMADVDRILDERIGGAVGELDGTISAAVADIDRALERAVDRLFVRLLQLVAIACAGVLLLVFLLRRTPTFARAE